MKRRVCETCAFFESAHFDKNGWCKHPSRTSSSDVRLMVRGSEIGCRNGWNSDFWVPLGSTQSEDDEAISAQGPLSTGFDEMTSFAPFRMDVESTSPTPEVHDDRVVDVTASGPAPSGERQKQASECVQDPREAIRLARLQFRSKRVQTGRIADSTAGKPVFADGADFDEPEDRVVGSTPKFVDTPLPAPQPPTYRVPPVKRTEIERTLPTITDFAEDAVRFESVPPATGGAKAADAGQTSNQPLGQQMPQRFLSDFEEDNPVSEAAPVVKRREPFVDRWFRRRREHQVWEETDVELGFNSETLDAYSDDSDSSYEAYKPDPVLPDRVVSHQPDRSTPDIQRSAEPQRQEPQFAPPPPPRQTPVAPPSRRAPVAPAARLEPAKPSARRDQAPPVHPYADFEPLHAWESGSEADHSDHAVIQKAMADHQLEDLPDWSTPVSPGYRASVDIETGDHDPVIAPDIPRVCRTCRDFKPTGTGERGWCNNNHAFSHRRMVEADELACGSSYWCWWLPHDGIWLKDFDASRHTMPTPRVDRMLAATHRYGRGEQFSDDDVRREG